MTFPAHTVARAATGAAALASALAYPFLPARVATHFDPDDQPDRWSSRDSTAATLPLLMAGLELANDRLGAWPGGRDREDSSSGVGSRESAVAVTELALLTAHLIVLVRNSGVELKTERLSRGLFGAFLIGLGNILPTLPRNCLIGIRTPWTLADPAVWERTHRVGGYAITAAGLVTLASLPASGPWGKRLPVAAFLAAVGWSGVFSYVSHARRSELRR